MFDIPQTVEQWSQFELSDEIANSWSHNLMKKTGINVHTIGEPYILFCFLEILDKMLDELGFSQFRFPVAQLQLILINSCIKFDSQTLQTSTFNSYIRLKLINTCAELNLIASIASHQQCLANIVLNLKQQQQQQQVVDSSAVNIGSEPLALLKLAQIDANEVCLLREQIHAYKLRLSNLQNEDAAMAAAGGGGGFNSTSLASMSSSNKKISINLANKKHHQLTSKATVKIDEGHLGNVTNSEITGKSDLEGVRFPGEMRKINNSLGDILYKDAWLLMAELLVDNGFFRTARDYLFECLNACQVGLKYIIAVFLILNYLFNRLSKTKQIKRALKTM
jgi:hypothetical protein